MEDKRSLSDNLNLNITQYISFFYKEFQRYCEEKLKPYDLTNGLYMYLIFVYKKPGRTLNEISKALEVDKALTTRAIKRLIEHGYVENIVDEKDNRAFNIYSTEKCDEAMVEMKNLFIEWEKIKLKGFSKEEIETFKNLFKKASLNVEA